MLTTNTHICLKKRTSLEDFFKKVPKILEFLTSTALSLSLYSVTTRQAGKRDWKMPCVFFYISSLLQILLVLYH